MRTFTKLAFVVATTALAPVAAYAHNGATSILTSANGTHATTGFVPNAVQTLTVDVTGATGNDFFDTGDPSNTIQTFNIGAGAHITDVSYDVNITANDPSYLSEATLAFTGSDTAAGDGVFLSPGVGEDGPGTASFSGSASLVDLGLDFTVGDDGILRLEYFETFNDGAVDPDSIWNSGTINFTYEGGTTTTPAVPEPATWAMMIGGFGLVGGAMRHRRSTRATFA